MWEPVVGKKRSLQSDILRQKSGHGPKHRPCQSGIHLQHAERPPGSQQVSPHHFGSLWQVTHSVILWCALLAVSQRHSPGQQRLGFFNISIQLSCYFSHKLSAIQRSNTKCLSPTSTMLECRPGITLWPRPSDGFRASLHPKNGANSSYVNPLLK